MTLAVPAAASYDAIAAKYDALYNTAHDRAENLWLARHLKDFDIFGYDSLLDIGCGTGLTLDLAALAERTPPYYLGIDPSAGMIRKARLNHPGKSFRFGSAEIADSFGRFQAVTALFGPYNYARFPTGLQKLALCRKPNYPSPVAIVVYTQRYVEHPKYCLAPAPPVQRTWTRDQLWNALRLCVPLMRDVTIHGFSSPDFYARDGDSVALQKYVDAAPGDACFLLALGRTR